MPKADICLIDHLVGAREQRRWYSEAERLGRFEIDHQLVLRWRLYRKIGRLLALDNAIDIAGGAPILIWIVGPVANKTTRAYKVAERIDGGQFVPRRERCNQIRMVCAKAARGDN